MTVPSTCVIYNPCAGRGRARTLIDQVRHWAAPEAELRATTAPAHGVELASQAVRDGFQRIIAAGGDGTVHEVANGILLAGNPAVILGAWPIGSSNDYAHALGLDAWWKARGEGVPLTIRTVDVGRVFSAKRTEFYVNCAGVGFNGMVALESRKIRWLRSIPLYAFAFLRAMWWHYRTPELRITFDSEAVTARTLALTVNLGRREGGFPITGKAVLDDGKFDCVHVADITRWQLVKFLPALIAGTLPRDHPKLRMPLAATVKVQSDSAMCIHADGEFFSKPEDGVTEATFEVLGKMLGVQGVFK